MRNLVLIIISILFSLSSYSQENFSQIKDAPNVFIDCDWNCDMDNFRKEVAFVNYMNDRQTADIYVLVTSQEVGSGGEKFILYFEGQGKMEGINLTKEVTTGSDDTDLEISTAIMNKFKSGLLIYLLKTPLADKIDFSIESETDSESETIQDDPWKGWRYSLSTGGNLNMEKNYRRRNLRFHASAFRIREENKIGIYGSYSSNVVRFFSRDTLDNIIDSLTYKSLNENIRLSAEYVKSINNHWSLGFFGKVQSSTYSNIKFKQILKTGIEYNYFPYSKSDRKQLTFGYNIGIDHRSYFNKTIYDKTDELLFTQNLEIGLYQKQNWGSVYLGLNYDSYLHDLTLYSISFNPNIDWNILKGLTFGVGGNFSLIQNQISLTTEDVSDSDILLRNKIQPTNWDMWGYFNIRYSFGSKFNNIVNSRFEGGSNTYYFF